MTSDEHETQSKPSSDFLEELRECLPETELRDLLEAYRRAGTSAAIADLAVSQFKKGLNEDPER